MQDLHWGRKELYEQVIRGQEQLCEGNKESALRGEADSDIIHK